MDDAAARLKLAFPAIFDDAVYWENPAEYTRSGRTNPVWCDDRDLIGTVRLAKALECPSVQVMALYHCCRLEAGVLFDGVQYNDAKVQFSYDELRLCAFATDKLYRYNTHVMNALTEMHSSPADIPRVIPCRTSADCMNALGQLMASGLQNGQFSSPCALDSLDEWIDENPEKMCFGCREALKGVINERRREVFDDLGALFGVEAWPPAEF